MRGRVPTWEENRPTVLKEGTAGKVRGFVDYERSPLPYRAEEERLQDWKEVGVCVLIAYLPLFIWDHFAPSVSFDSLC